MGQAGGRGRREVVTLSLVFILSYVSPGARKNPKHVPIGPHKCRQAAEGYPVSPRSERAVALTSWGSRPSLPNEYNVFILCTSDATETVVSWYTVVLRIYGTLVAVAYNCKCPRLAIAEG